MPTVGVPTVGCALHVSTRDHCRCADSGFANASLTIVGAPTVVQRAWHGPKVWPQLAWPALAMHLVGFDLHEIPLAHQTQVRVFFGRIGQTGAVSDFGVATHCDTACHHSSN